MNGNFGDYDWMGGKSFYKKKEIGSMPTVEV
jgi:hypothetical protein